MSGKADKHGVYVITRHQGADEQGASGRAGYRQSVTMFYLRSMRTVTTVLHLFQSACGGYVETFTDWQLAECGVRRLSVGD